MINKTGSSPQEFQPSETIKETTVVQCEIFTSPLRWKHWVSAS